MIIHCVCVCVCVCVSLVLFLWRTLTHTSRQNGNLLANVTEKSVVGYTQGFKRCCLDLVSLHPSAWLLPVSALTSAKPSQDD